tara:strand:- start:3354 stop:3581 length:228 start_codon:yes stop_codon:yes gene_type:complete
MAPDSLDFQDCTHWNGRDATNGIVVRGITSGNDDGLLVFLEEPTDGNEAMGFDFLGFRSSLPVVVADDILPMDYD